MTMTLSSLLQSSTTPPAARGFRMPAEWETHAATWLAWPSRESDWPGKFPLIPYVYAEIIRHLTRVEPVHVIVPNTATEDQVKDLLQKVSANLNAVQFWTLPTDRSWVRDSGPMYLLNAQGQKAILDWRFNAWAKYDDWQADDALPAAIAQIQQIPYWQPLVHGQRVVLEGGAIDVNGQGWLLTTEECLLSTTQQRNPHLWARDYEQLFADYLGCSHVIWLKRGIVGDDTHGHVDDLARFVGPRTVVTAVEKNPHDDNYLALQENLDILRNWRGPNGEHLEVFPLPMPQPLYYEGMRLPASYANFYIANGMVLVPTFNDPADRHALGLLAELFPDREVIGIHSVDLVWGLGTLHCMTQQEPSSASPLISVSHNVG
jgi:agmatine deiminase